MFNYFDYCFFLHAGRVSAFTSGAENPHYVERVSSGRRYALTVSFTCDPKFAIKDPSRKKLSE